MDAERVRAPNERVQQYFEEAELEAIAKTVVVPSNDDDVRRRLRELGETVELEHEDRADRRARLRRLLALHKARGIDVDEASDSDSEPESEDSWSEGPPGLEAARRRIADAAACNVQLRLAAERERWRRFTENRAVFTNEELVRRRQENQQLRSVGLVGAQSGFTRAAGSIASAGGRYVTVGDWSGTLTVLDMQNDMEITDQAAPHSTAGMAQTCVAWADLIASGGANGSIALHELHDGHIETKAQVAAHTARVARIVFHPSSAFFMSASYDNTWRLWDTVSASCVLEQTGHTGAVMALALHEDGALLFTGGEDKAGNLWDLRTGSSVMTLTGHAKAIHASSWRQNTLVTGGADNQCFVWDLRRHGKPLTAIPAHNSVVTDISVKANTLASSSLDGTVRLWSCDDWRLQRTLHSPSRVLALAAIDDGWVSARWDRCVDWYKIDGELLL